MACGSSCCPPPAKATSEPMAPSTLQIEDSGCCGNVGPIEDQDGAMLGATAGQCDMPGQAQGANLDDECCARQPADGEEVGCNKGCCQTATATATELPGGDDMSTPSCCQGKASPCCDESCLDRLALRECDETTLSGKACAEHSLKTRKTYADRLEALGCICRALIALGQESCCLPRSGSSIKSTAGSRKAPLPPARASIESCRTTGATETASCCSVKRRPGSKKAVADSCCTKKQTTVSASDIPAGISPATDLEKGLSAEKQHVVLSISGMTCTGCETKLLGTLGTHPAVKSLKTSLILARAEFDLVGPASAAEVMKHLERTTEFKCEMVTDRGENLDVLADADVFVSQPWPGGVIATTKVDNKTVNISFDPKIIGARDLVDRGWSNGPLRLAAPRPDPTLEAGSKHVRHVGYMTLLSACLTIPVLVMAWAPLPARHIEYASASLALATLVQFVIAGPFYPKALKALIFSRVIEMDLLVVLSTSAAYIFSVVSFGHTVAGQPLSTGEFFETSTLLVTLIMVGRWASALARQKAVESISIRSLQTATAIVVDDEGEKEMDARLLQYGDVFKVAPDSRIPTDGTVISGTSEVDESMITGESMPVEKQAKSPVIAGSINGSGILHVRLTRLPGDNTISTIARMVDEAKLSKPKIQEIADRVASYFVPVIVALAAIVFCIWIAVGIRVRGQTGSEATIQAITYAITVLIVSCPCAIGLAVPMVIVMATGIAAERGVIFKSAEGIETAHKASHVVFDKTGTITEGRLTVAGQWYADGDLDATKSLLLGLVGSIKHPVSAAVAAQLRADGVSAAAVSNVKSVAGSGVEGIAETSGLSLQAGNSRWLGVTADTAVKSALAQGYTTICFTIGSSLAAVFSLGDSIRSDAAATVKTLLDRGVSVHIISGDDDLAVRSVANRLNISAANVRSRCTPGEKQAYIRSLLEMPPPATLAYGSRGERKTAEKPPVVIFCGDGTNDAVALAQATIGVHMNEGGTDVAESAADVVLMRPHLAGILTAMAVSRKSMRRVAFNFGWSFVYNLFAILLAAGAFVNVNARIPPEFAGLGELVSVLPVIAAAVLLRWSKI